MVKGGDCGAALEPRKPDTSLLVRPVRREVDAEIKMPPVRFEPEKTKQETGLVPWKKDSDNEIMAISSDFVLGRLFIDKRVMQHLGM